MITSKTPLTRRIKLAMAMIVIAALGVATVQAAAAQPMRSATAAHTKGKKHGKRHLKVRMINPFYGGIDVKPRAIRYFDGTNNLPPTVEGLVWQRWGGRRAVAVGQDKRGNQVDVRLSARRKCGMPRMRFYTRITVNGETFRLQCKLQVITATNIGKATEDVSGLSKLRGYDISIPVKSATIAGAKWRRFGRPKMTGRGVASAWWSPHDFRWVPALMVQSKPRYCPQFGAIVYAKVRLIGYGNGIEEGSIPFKRAARVLRKQVGHGAKHSLRYNYTKWCKRKKYPMMYWEPWK